VRFLRFVIQSYVFKRIVPYTIVLLLLVMVTNKLFDYFWNTGVSIPLLDINNVYKPPRQYDNYTRINLLLTPEKKVAIEGNKKFRIWGKQKGFDFYDTTGIKFPEQTLDVTNNIYLEFENSNIKDSIMLVISKGPEKDIFWKQIFLSTVIVEDLNQFSNDPDKFRVNENTLVEPLLLSNNDTLISKVINYFETHKEKFGLGDCGKNSETFRDICIKFNLPVRIIGLQGGDADQPGYNGDIGFPLHAVCEIYSSKLNKWYIIDPTYGLRFRNPGADDYLNAIEISNMFFFQREKFIIQDSVLSTKRTLMGRDYFKYYENIFFREHYNVIRFGNKFMKIFYSKFNYDVFHYTNRLLTLKNGFYYFGAKTFVYFLISIFYFNAILLVITRRLFSAKKPKNY
jgi:hypothetical protein